MPPRGITASDKEDDDVFIGEDAFVNNSENDSGKENDESEFEESEEEKPKGKKGVAKRTLAKKAAASKKTPTAASKKRATPTSAQNMTPTGASVAKPRLSISPSSGPVRRVGLSRLNVPKGPPSPVRLPSNNNNMILK